MTTLAMIPARMGSERLKMKNLALLNGRPLISYAIEAAKTAGMFDRIIVNSENEIFREVARRYAVEFYRRPMELGSSDTRSDAVVYDFMRQYPCDILAWVNPTSPLQTGEEIRKVVNYFIDQKSDTLITVKSEQVHCVYEGKPVNFSTEEPFAKTQDLNPVRVCVYSVMMWRTKKFMESFEKKGHALLSGKVDYFPVGKLSSIVIKKEEDLMMAELLLKTLGDQETFKVRYDDLAEGD